jgi:ribonuclease Z
MALRMPFRYLEPTFFAGLLDDPVLWVRVRPWGRALLFDCGQLHHLAKRTLKSLAALFVTHAHMDHFMGFDTLVRHVLVSPRVFDVFGPPGLADKIEHKLSAYDWNLNEHFWCTFRVHEIFSNRIQRWLFPGPYRFKRQPDGSCDRIDRIVYSNQWVRVEAQQVDHHIPVLLYRITEQPTFSLDADRLAVAGLAGGPWIKQLKRQFHKGLLGKEALPVMRTHGKKENLQEIADTRRLYEAIRKRVVPSSIGYMTDLGYSGKNETAVIDLLQGVTLLVGECAFLADHVEKARRSRHLCTLDMNLLLQKLRPAFYLPVHLSKSCGEMSQKLYQELEPPVGTTLVHLPERLLPRPLLPCEVRLGS